MKLEDATSSSEICFSNGENLDDSRFIFIKRINLSHIYNYEIILNLR